MARPGRAKAILLVDGDPSALSEIGRFMRRAGYAVVAADSGEAAIEAARGEPPTVALISVNLPDGCGFEIYRELRDVFGAALPVVFLSATPPNPGDEVAALLLGADDYVTKPVVPDVLLARVRRLADPTDPDPTTASHPLTHREMEVLKLLMSGLGEAEIARDLYITPKTVAKHIEHILGKLGVHSRAQAVAEAVRSGIAQEPEARLGGTASRHPEPSPPPRLRDA